MKQFKVFIVDEDDRNFLKYGFEQNNVDKVFLYKDGVELLTFLNTSSHVLPSIIVSDFNMPVISGLELTRELKKNKILQKFPLFIFSTHGSATQVKKCLQSGAAGYFIKPNSLDKIVNIIKEDILPLSKGGITKGA